MKLAIVRQIYNPNGGAERFVSRSLNILTRNTSLEITLISRQWKKNSNWKLLTVNPIFYNRVTRESGFAVKASSYFSQFDIVQTHERIPGATIFRAGDGVHATWLEQYFRTLSPLVRWSQSFSRYHQYVLQTEKKVFSHPKLRKVICNSKMVRDDIIRRFTLSDDMITVIYNGVDTLYFNPKVRSQSQRAFLGIPQDAPVLSCVGSNFNRKGIATALYAIVPYSNVWLVIAGRDKHENKFKNLAKNLGVALRVRFLGSVTDIRQVYGTADALILPTLYDPFPNVCLEALACGLPLLISSSCGAAEWIIEGKNGWVRNALDNAGYQQAVGAWLEGIKKGVNYSSPARETVKPYTLNRMAKELHDIYRDLLC